MPYSLKRVRDGAGDSGPMSKAVYIDDEAQPAFKENARPEVGVQMIVGSYIARTMENQDYWHTTTITEILEEKIEDSKEYVKFKTGNSVYEWRAF